MKLYYFLLLIIFIGFILGKDIAKSNDNNNNNDKITEEEEEKEENSNTKSSAHKDFDKIFEDIKVLLTSNTSSLENKTVDEAFNEIKGFYEDIKTPLENIMDEYERKGWTNLPLMPTINAIIALLYTGNNKNTMYISSEAILELDELSLKILKMMIKRLNQIKNI
jgi:hypothetical protein